MTSCSNVNAIDDVIRRDARNAPEPTADAAADEAARNADSAAKFASGNPQAAAATAD